MLDKIIFYTKRWINCIETPGRSESFEKWAWKEIKNEIKKSHIYICDYCTNPWGFNSFENLFKKYHSKRDFYMTQEILNYTKSYVIKKAIKEFYEIKTNNSDEIYDYIYLKKGE